ncbi:MAG TPA: CoA pyrophosphatase [Sandaracinaceae bacterium LLY-WYZ-13_1]|nr:CoA pyrophosphatase [Sandaracinaceae bacterium LLY-WYZ-13_1]
MSDASERGAPDAPSVDLVRRRVADVRPRSTADDPGAAVATVLRERARGPEVLLIRRAEHPGDPWSGHMAFPGGRRDPGDPSLDHTAVRETHEELGLHLPSVGGLVGRLDDVPTHKTGLVVRPFVWVVDSTPALRPNYEVDEVHWVALASLMSGERDTTFELEWKGQRHRFPGYEVADRIVWGLTYRMLRILFEVLERERPRADD